MNFYNFEWNDIHEKLRKFKEFEGKKLMIVNVASECGFTPQYEQLQELYEHFSGENFEVLAFPCNDFGAQEPGTHEEIESFCERNYNVNFPMFSKVVIRGDTPSPLYQWLTQKSQNGKQDAEVKWNFHKFLVDEKGTWVASLASDFSPIDPKIADWIKTGTWN